jgi:hypothetical protein
MFIGRNIRAGELAPDCPRFTRRQIARIPFAGDGLVRYAGRS